ncbi:MAG TPA: hypothetical protein VFF27_00235 [Bacteroidia bacterium]|jgi:hypothetical protein|nr:hypothetical protein [Bacteroidia bacterium]
MITVTQDSTNKIMLKVTTAISSPYFLINFTNCYTNRSTVALFQNRNSNGSYYLIWIVEVGENGTEDKVNGQLKLGPSGDWQADVYVQSSSMNLNTNQATFIETIDVIVKSSGCVYTSDDDACPDITEIDGGSLALGDSQFSVVNGLLDGCSL